MEINLFHVRRKGTMRRQSERMSELMEVQHGDLHVPARTRQETRHGDVLCNSNGLSAFLSASSTCFCIILRNSNNVSET